VKSLLTVTAFLEVGAGLALLGVPSAMAALLLGAPLGGGLRGREGSVATL